MRTIFAVIITIAFAAPALPQQSTNQPKAGTTTAKPAEKKERKGTKWDQMDTGPFFSSGIAGKHQTLKGLAIKLGTNASVCFDTELMRMSFGWTGGFLRL